MTWEGKEYRLPGNRQLLVICQVEDILTFGDLATAELTKRLPIGKMSMAFGVMLRSAGCNVTDDDVYKGIFKDPKTAPQNALAALYTLQALMFPPDSFRKAPAKKDEGTERESAPSVPATGSSSAKDG